MGRSKADRELEERPCPDLAVALLRAHLKRHQQQPMWLIAKCVADSQMRG